MYFDFVQKELPMMFSRWEEYRAAHGTDDARPDT